MLLRNCIQLCVPMFCCNPALLAWICTDIMQHQEWSCIARSWSFRLTSRPPCRYAKSPAFAVTASLQQRLAPWGRCCLVTTICCIAAVLQLWDIGSQVKSLQMAANYLQGCDAVVAVYDITRQQVCCALLQTRCKG